MVGPFHHVGQMWPQRWIPVWPWPYYAAMKLRRGQQQITADPSKSSGLPRITTPYVRDTAADGTSALRPATWDEALDRAAEGFSRARDAIEHGNANAFGMFSCSKATNEVNYLAQKWARVVMGSNNIDSCNRT